MTDQELQSLRNMGNECEAAADEIDSLRTQLAAAQKLAADRLEQMQADRAQALRWRDEVEALRKDAERWRFMARHVELDSLGNDIDAAMAQEQQ